MAFELSGITNVFYSWLKSGMFWVIIAIILTFATLLILWWKKRIRLKYNVFEIVSFGNGKVGINLSKAGLFKEKSALGGLWDYGNEFRFKTNDGRIIRNATTDDLHDLFGKKGFIVRRKDDDVKILVPINRIDWDYKKVIKCPKCHRNFRYDDNLEAPLFEIAPSDFRDASIDIVKEAQKETSGFLEKYLPYILLGGIVIFFIISMILASQFFNRTVDKCADIMTTCGGNTGTPSTTAP